MTESTPNINKSHKQYNYCLDFIKGLACIFVVFMHCEFPGKAGTIVQSISRFSVPFFFMVSGYFSNSSINPLGEVKSPIINKKVKHIFKIVFWASLFYLVWAIFRNLIWHDNELSISKTQIVVWLVFNQPAIIGGHLWFLFALLYDYVLVSLFDRTRSHNRQYVFGAISMILLFVLGQGVHLLEPHIPISGIVQSNFGITMPEHIRIPNLVYRNWIIEGLAFFMLGRWIKENKNRINVSNSVLIIVLVVSTALCLLERQIMGRDFGVNICTLPQVAALFLYAVKNPERYASLLQRIGRDCSMLVYILHMFVWGLLAKLYGAMGIDENLLAQYLLPIFVVIISMVLAVLFNRIVLKLKKEPQKTN